MEVKRYGRVGFEGLRGVRCCRVRGEEVLRV